MKANLALLRGAVVQALVISDLTAGGQMVETLVEHEIVDDNLTGAAIITRNGIRYRVTVDLA